MDESEYKSTYNAVNPLTCPFEKSILARRCDCEHAVRFNLADREGAGCRFAKAQGECTALLSSLRHNAQFALGLTRATNTLPHAREMKVQVGGLMGLQRIVFPDLSEQPVENIHRLVAAALKQFAALEDLPYQEINQSVAHYRVRQRRRSHRDK